MTRDLNEKTSGFKTALRKHEQSEFFTQNNLGILQFVKLKCRLIAEVNQTIKARNIRRVFFSRNTD